jgi:hypothetical protein
MSSTDVDTRWFATTSRVCSNHHAAIAVSTAPLFGMPSFITTSKADTRSVVTNRSCRSPRR